MNYHLGGLSRSKKDRLTGLLPKEILDRRDVDFLLSISDLGELLGVLCFRLTESVAEILYVTVLPHARLQGVCTGLIRGLVDRIDDAGLDIPIEVFWDESNDPVFGRIIRSVPGFSVTKSPEFFSVSPDDLKSSEICAKILEKEFDTKPWGEASPIMQKRAMGKIADIGFGAFVNQKEKYLPDLSALYIEDEEVRAAIFFKRPEEKVLELAFVWSEAGTQKPIIAVLSGSIRKVLSNYSDHYVEFTAINDSVLKQARLMFPETTPEHIYSAIRFGKV